MHITIEAKISSNRNPVNKRILTNKRCIVDFKINIVLFFMVFSLLYTLELLKQPDLSTKYH